MSCESIMIRNPKSVREEDTIGMAARDIVENHCISLPVVDADGRFVGLFGIFDLRRPATQRDSTPVPA